MTSAIGPEEAWRKTCEMWGKCEPVHYTHVSTSGFQCKIDFFDKPNQPKITCYPWKIVGYVLEKLGIATIMDVIRKDKHEVIYINTKNLIKWRHSINLESCKGVQINQAKAIDCILTGEGIQGQIPLNLRIKNE